MFLVFLLLAFPAVSCFVYCDEVRTFLNTEHAEHLPFRKQPMEVERETDVPSITKDVFDLGV